MITSFLIGLALGVHIHQASLASAVRIGVGLAVCLTVAPFVIRGLPEWWQSFGPVERWTKLAGAVVFSVALFCLLMGVGAAITYGLLALVW